jgi:hypothetical protein
MVDWAAGSDNVLFTLGVSGGTGPSVFELTSGPTPDQAWYFEIGGLEVSNNASPFYASSTELALPITLASFAAQVLPNSGGVGLKWSTVSEIQNYGFYVQRRAEDVAEFADLAESFIAGHGTTQNAHEYTFTDKTVTAGKWWYRLRQVDTDGTVHFSEPILADALTFVKEVAPIEFALTQNYPNPFNPSTEIKFSVQTAGHASLMVYNISGQLVARLFEGVAEPGQYYRARLDGANLATGVYIYRLQTEKQTQVRKMMLMK